MTSPADVPLPDDPRARLRAADADRELVHEILSAAMANGSLSMSEYEERSAKAVVAKTFGELDDLTDDLPVRQLGVPIPPAVVPAYSQQAAAGPFSGSYNPSEASGRHLTQNAIAIMSGAEVGGRSAVGDHLQAVAVMGGVEIDLRAVHFTAPRLEIRCLAIMGGVDITVPPDLNVEVGGFAVMGGFGRKGAGPGVPGAPTVSVTGFALMGGVEVKRKERKN